MIACDGGKAHVSSAAVVRYRDARHGNVSKPSLDPDLMSEENNMMAGSRSPAAKKAPTGA